MGKYSLIDRPGSLLNYQANAYLSTLLSDLQNGQISAKTDLLGKVAAIFNQFYANLGAPLVAPMLFTGIPVAEDWNQYQRLLQADLGILYQQTLDINSASNLQHVFATTETNMLKEAVNTLSNRVASFQATRPTRIGQQNWNVSDNFLNPAKIDTHSSIGINIINGAIELAPIQLEDFTSEVSLFVDDEYVNAAIYGTRTVGSIGSGASNGFVGNLHEVITSENITTTTSPVSSTISQAIQLNAKPGESISFAGDGNLRADVGALTDGNPQTWFEYEVCNIPDALKFNPSQNYGFTIKVPSNGTSSNPMLVSWCNFHNQDPLTSEPSFFPAPPSTTHVHAASSEVTTRGNYAASSVGPGSSPFSTTSLNLPGSAGSVNISQSGAAPSGATLRLVLGGTFKNPQRITQITILPNVLANKAPIVRTIQVLAVGATEWTTGIPLKEDNTSSLSNTTLATPQDPISIWTFPSTLVQGVRILIEQPQAYATKIGHQVWAAATTQDPGLANNVLGQGILNSNNINLTRIDGPSIDLNRVLTHPMNVQDTVEGIESYTSNSASGTTTVGPLLEVFDGWRYAIGLRDISFLSTTYQNTGTLLSQDFSVPIDIKKISLDVREYVPQTTAQVDWITYAVSVDGGSSWYPIAPRTYYSSSSPRSYVVNPNTGPAVISANSGFIYTNAYGITNPVSSIRLRAMLQRGSDSTITPRLLSYTINLEGGLA